MQDTGEHMAHGGPPIGGQSESGEERARRVELIQKHTVLRLAWFAAAESLRGRTVQSDTCRDKMEQTEARDCQVRTAHTDKRVATRKQ